MFLQLRYVGKFIKESETWVSKSTTKRKIQRDSLKGQWQTAKSFLWRVKIYKYICGPVSAGFAKNFSRLTRSSYSALNLWKMWRPTALRVVVGAMKLFHRVCKTNNFNLIQLHFHGYPALYNPLETHCDEFTWYRGGLTKNSSPFLQAENEGNPGNCDGISARYCCEMEEMLNLVFILGGRNRKLKSLVFFIM